MFLLSYSSVRWAAHLPPMFWGRSFLPSQPSHIPGVGHFLYLSRKKENESTGGMLASQKPWFKSVTDHLPSPPVGENWSHPPARDLREVTSDWAPAGIPVKTECSKMKGRPLAEHYTSQFVHSFIQSFLFTF
jgi:hypothetical protein